MGLPNRLSGTLPASVAAHLGVLVLLVVIPLAADVSLPIPAASMERYMRAVPAPPPPPAPPTHVPRSTAPPVARDTVPVEAPPRIVPEAPRLPDLPPAVPYESCRPSTDDPCGSPGGVAWGTASGVMPLPPPPPVPAGPVHAADLVRPPIKIVDARPVYPPLARAAHVEGTVILEAVLDRAGRVGRLRVVRSVPLLDQAAMDAVQQWQYTPTTLHGLPVEVLMTITVTFSLQQ